MAKYRGDTYVIERDEREIGGDLTVIATYGDWKEAKAAFDKLEDPIDEDVLFWLSRRNRGNENDVVTITSKPVDVAAKVMGMFAEAVEDLGSTVKRRKSGFTRH